MNPFSYHIPNHPETGRKFPEKNFYSPIDIVGFWCYDHASSTERRRGRWHARCGCTAVGVARGRSRELLHAPADVADHRLQIFSPGETGKSPGFIVSINHE